MQNTKEQRVAALDEAIEQVGIVAFSKSVNRTHQAVYQWRKNGHVPFVVATQIETLYGVPREKLIKPEEAAAYLTPSGGVDGSDLL